MGEGSVRKYPILGIMHTLPIYKMGSSTSLVSSFYHKTQLDKMQRIKIWKHNWAGYTYLSLLPRGRACLHWPQPSGVDGWLLALLLLNTCRF